jgi:tRNA threonylcarbamoyladenosine biosynthesis protein TsaB
MSENILAIDASTEACSVALISSEQVIHEFCLAPRKHAELLLPMVDKILSRAGVKLTELDAIACSLGPGAFTGLRIAIATAQGLSYAANVPCIGVSSLETLACQAFSELRGSQAKHVDYVLTSIDARMKEVYFATYKQGRNGLPELIGEEQVIAPLQIVLTKEITQQFGTLDETSNTFAMVKVGNGFQEYEFPSLFDSIQTTPQPILYPDARHMLPIAQQKLYAKQLTKPELLQPVYIRNNVAKKKSDQK